MKLDFEYIEKEILKHKAKSEYQQVSIVILRDIFKEAESKQCNLTDVVSMYCDCEKPTLGVNTWTCGCGKWFKKVKK